jgi:hypothetical protein
VGFHIGPNKPCYDGDEPYMKHRNGLDVTFEQRDDCDSKYDGSLENKEYVESGLTISEYQLLDENGVLKDLIKQRRPSRDNYKDEPHKRFDYKLYFKRYSAYKTSCKRDGYGVDRFQQFVVKMDYMHMGFLGVLIC